MSLDKVINTNVVGGALVATSCEASSQPTSAAENAPGDRVPPSEAAWLVSLLQAGDSFYPTGSYAHSFGLEGLVQEGVIRDRATLREFIFHSVLPSLQRVELPLAAHAWQAFGMEDWNKIGELGRLSAALKASHELRAASANIGRQRAELVALLRPHSMAKEYLRRAGESEWQFSAPISAALEGQIHGAPQIAVLSGVFYTSVGSWLAAAMKELRIGQNASQSLLTETLSTAPAIIVEAGKIPVEEIGWFNPWLDIASARHETAESRLFIS